MSRDPFDLTPALREQLGRSALDWVLDWFSGTGARRVYPDTSASALDERLSAPLPAEPQDPHTILGEFAAHVARGSRDNGNPRMFGYVQSSGTYVGAVADFLASALNQNVTSWRSAPAATTIERQVIRWMKEKPGLSQDEFIDDIPFPETQFYVKRILGTAEDYRALYGSGFDPSLSRTGPKPRGASGGE